MYSGCVATPTSYSEELRQRSLGLALCLSILFYDYPDDLSPLKFATWHDGREAERLTRFIWERIVCLLEHGEEREANSLLEEFDEPPLCDDVLN